MGIVTADMAVSLDLVGAGRDQSLEHPFGPHVGHRLHRWMFEQPEQNAAAIEQITEAGAYVMGRTCSTPAAVSGTRRGRGWWGEEPPYHAPVFVLTHHPREPLTMAGGTTFTFVTDGAARRWNGPARRPATAASRSPAACDRQPVPRGRRDRRAAAARRAVHRRPWTRVFDGVDDLAMTPVSSRTTPHVSHLVHRRA